MACRRRRSCGSRAEGQPGGFLAAFVLSAPATHGVAVGRLTEHCEASSLLSVFKEEIEKLYWEDETWADKLTDKLSNTRRLCEMKDLAKLLRAQRLDVIGYSDGSAALEKAVVGSDPVFLDAIRHDNFHSKSYAVQRACLAAFDDMELIAEAVAKAYEGAKKSHASDVQLLMTLNKAARQACQMTPACLAERELRSRPSHEEL
ncbi:unnamed protein product [Effrenium voratum]|uniref:Uncharacterized protein n=1 Tax=Effrenium voratum TaxID=2562239 RepID=A0AA36NIF2_9DINO|nr:unnamed protein product [Effrenium voratum]